MEGRHSDGPAFRMDVFFASEPSAETIAKAGPWPYSRFRHTAFRSTVSGFRCQLREPPKNHGRDAMILRDSVEQKLAVLHIPAVEARNHHLRSQKHGIQWYIIWPVEVHVYMHPKKIHVHKNIISKELYRCM